MMCVPSKRSCKVYPIAVPIKCGVRKYKDLPVLTDRDEYELNNYIQNKEKNDRLSPQIVVVKNKNVNVV